MRTESNLLLNVFPAASRISHSNIFAIFAKFAIMFSFLPFLLLRAFLDIPQQDLPCIQLLLFVLRYFFFAKLAEQILSHLFVFSRQLQKFFKCATGKNAFRFDNI